MMRRSKRKRKGRLHGSIEEGFRVWGIITSGFYIIDVMVGVGRLVLNVDESSLNPKPHVVHMA